MRAVVVVGAALLAAGCAMRTEILARPADGYPAIRFTETVRFTGALGNTWEFPVGTTLVADRRRATDGATMYCGPMLIRDLVTESRPICVMLAPGKIFINTEYLQQGFERDLPPGAVEETRVR
jgi:hypothetical protein